MMTLSRTISILLLSVLTILSGCAASPALSMPDAAPADFVLAVTVYAQNADANPRPTAMVPARYILETDATLRVSVGPGSSASSFPRPMRNLNTVQLERCWQLVRAIGLDQQTLDEAIRPVSSPEIYSPSDEHEVVYLLEIRSLNTQHAYEINPGNPGARALVEHLASLGWLRAD